MKENTVTDSIIEEFAVYLRREEKSQATQKKYIRDVRLFQCCSRGREISRDTVVVK